MIGISDASFYNWQRRFKPGKPEDEMAARFIPVEMAAPPVLENALCAEVRVRQIIGSIFPEKLSFDKGKGRTGRVNEAVRLIYALDKGFSEIKKPDSGGKSPEPGEVTLLGLMSNHFLNDLKLLAYAFRLI